MNLASKFLADQKYGPGVIVEIGGDAEVQAAGQESSSVCGITVTTADFILNNALTGPNVVLVALHGRAQTEVAGPVCKGDLLVVGPSGALTSVNSMYDDLSGSVAPGTIVAKALEDTAPDATTTQIWVLITAN